MSQSIIVHVVGFCTRRPWAIVIVAIVMAVAAGAYSARHFAITTDVDKLVSRTLAVHQREIEFEKAFPERTIIVVVSAPTPELVKHAADRLAQRLTELPDVIRGVSQPGGGDFFERNALLYLPLDRLTQTMQALSKAEPILSVVAEDPSLRGALKALSLGAAGVKHGVIKLDDLRWPLALARQTAERALAEQPTSFSWQVLLQGRPADTAQLQRIIEVDPVLNYSALRPGHAAAVAIRRAAADLQLAENDEATVRLTGAVPISDAQYAVIKHGAVFNTLITMVAVLVILGLALRSARIVFAVFLSLLVGLAATTAVGLGMVGALSLVSVAFAVLFVGLGVDFAIQFSVRYRSERHDKDDVRDALMSAAKKAGGPLALAAAATAVGFFSFVPTDYRGLSELGQIAGCGMLIAFACSISLVPAILSILRAPSEPEGMGFAALAPVDRFLERHRTPVIVGTFAVVLMGAPWLFRLSFDFNPINLQNPHDEAVATYLALRKEPMIGANAIDVVAPSLDAANAMAKEIAALPTVSRTMTASNFVPGAQDQKLPEINRTAATLNSALTPAKVASPPSDAAIIEALKSTAGALSSAAQEQTGTAADEARQVSQLFNRLANGAPATRARVEATVGAPLKGALDELRRALHPQHITPATLPSTLVRDWVTSAGKARVEVLPNGDADDSAVLTKFATSVLRVAPTATGPGIAFYEAGRIIIRAFVEAGLFAFLAIAILLWIALRRLGDVALTLVPLLMAGTVTLELSALTGLSLNFANIIALPLLLGVGVAFKIYYIMAWRAGETRLLQSTLTRAVVFSAMTSATAFGSLWASSDPGMSSMGELMVLSLICTMAAAVLFQPVLMGPPRQTQ
jgi:uncharacterized protein